MPRILVLLLLCAACKRAPEYCNEDLSGVWVNSSDAKLAYRLRDQGGVVRGEFMERKPDGGLSAPEEPLLFELHRTDTAVAGVMRTRDQLLSGRTCPVEYGARISDCKPDSMQLVVETSAAIDQDCKRTRLPDGGEVPAELREYRLDRLK